MPLTFLSGLFYFIEQLPPFWQQLSFYNPFFYDGFRHAFLGVGDSDPWLSIGIVTGFAVFIVLLVLVPLAYRLALEGVGLMSKFSDALFVRGVSI